MGPQYIAGEAGGGDDGGKGKGKGKGNTLRSGKQNDRDPEKKNPKYPPEFWEWYHKLQNTKDYKLPGQPDPNIDGYSKIGQIWVDQSSVLSLYLQHHLRAHPRQIRS